LLGWVGPPRLVLGGSGRGAVAGPRWLSGLRWWRVHLPGWWRGLVRLLGRWRFSGRRRWWSCVFGLLRSWWRWRRFLSVSLFWRRGVVGRPGGVDHVDGRRVVRLVDQDGQLVVRQRDILHCWRGVASTTTISSIGVGWLWWRREVYYWWFLSRVDDGSCVFHWRSVELLVGSSVAFLRGPLVPGTGSYQERSQ